MSKFKCLTISVLIAMIMVIGVGCSDKNEEKNKNVTDIVMNGNEIDFNVDRKFYLYTDNPEDVKNAKPQKEVEVVFSGTGNIGSGDFEGNVSVEGLELGGNNQGYNLSKSENGYSLNCMGGNIQGIEPVEGPIYNYIIDITENFDDIRIWVIGTDESKPEEWYWVLEKGE